MILKILQCNYKDGADEIIYQDVVASLYGKNSLLDLINTINKKIFIPLTVGGGIRNIEDIKRILKTGADKIAINTAAVQDPNLITQAAQIFGSSTIVVAIEVSKNKANKYEVFTNNGRERTKWLVEEWAKLVESKGAGEIFLTSIDKEGTGKKFDMELTKKISKQVKIPVICHGGGSEINDIIDVVSNTDVSGVSLASMLHYNLILNNKYFKDKAFKINDNLKRISNIDMKKKVYKNNLINIKKKLCQKFISRSSE